MRGIVVLAVSAGLVVTCSGAPTTPSTSSPGAPSPSPSVALASPATSSATGDIVVGGDRPVTVHVPPSYAADHPAPLLIVLHGYGLTGGDYDVYLGLRVAAAERGYLYASPDGTLDSTGRRFWNATDACCDFDGTGVDDAAYLEGVIDAIAANVSVDPRRISLVGHSNGGFMSYAFACAHADRIASLVSIAGATFSQPADYPGAKATTTAWAMYDGCDPSAVPVDGRIDVDADISFGGAPAEAGVSRWTGCDPGGAVELWTVPGGGHDLNVYDAFPAAIFDFLEAHPKP